MGSLKVMLTHYEVRDELRRLGADETTDAFWRVANTDALLREVGTACQAELRKLREENEWIPVTERLPEEMAGVILAFVYQGNRNVTGDAYMNRGSWWSFGIEITDPIAWRPLPKAPEGG